MKGRGIPSIRSKVRGDQYVTVNVEVPRNLNSKQKNFCVNLKKIKIINKRNLCRKDERFLEQINLGGRQ